MKTSSGSSGNTGRKRIFRKPHLHRVRKQSTIQRQLQRRSGLRSNSTKLERPSLRLHQNEFRGKHDRRAPGVFHRSRRTCYFRLSDGGTGRRNSCGLRRKKHEFARRAKNAFWRPVFLWSIEDGSRVQEKRENVSGIAPTGIAGNAVTNLAWRVQDLTALSHLTSAPIVAFFFLTLSCQLSWMPLVLSRSAEHLGIVGGRWNRGDALKAGCRRGGDAAED